MEVAARGILDQRAFSFAINKSLSCWKNNQNETVQFFFCCK